jgi:hypothetical protein
MSKKSKSHIIAMWAVAGALVGIPVGALLILQARSEYDAKHKPLKFLKDKYIGCNEVEFKELTLEGGTIGMVVGAGAGATVGLGVVALTAAVKTTVKIGVSATTTVASTIKHSLFGKSDNSPRSNSDAVDATVKLAGN